MPQTTVPIVDVGPLFAGPSAARAVADREIMDAAAQVGFFAATGFDHRVPIGKAVRADVLRIFDLEERDVLPLFRQKFAPGHTNLYRGWFPRQRGFLTCKEGIDLGADVAYGPAVVHPQDPLRERTPLPAEELLPGWGSAIARYYLGMEYAGRTLMRSIARGLGLEEHYFDSYFAKGLSTLRLIRYPLRTDLDEAQAANPGLWVEHCGQRFHLIGTPHVDTGFLTLLAQDGVAGLQARHRLGGWLDVPPTEGLLAVNFGEVLERWSGGITKATEHRVIGYGTERRSIPFFYEARADAEIKALPTPTAAQFEPFYYGDHLWRSTTQFVEFKGMEALRKPQRA